MSSDVLVVTQDLTVNSEQRELIKSLLAPEATEMEMELFLYDNRRRGVHPLDRLIHFTKRNGKYTPVTSIHYMRLRADEGGRAGQDEPAFKGKEAMADYECKVTVRKQVPGEKITYTGTAKWKEFYPGEQGGFMWRKMPSHMLSKCAEAVALRLAFPRELAGLYIQEELESLGDEANERPIPTNHVTLKDKLKSKVEHAAAADAHSDEGGPPAPSGGGSTDDQTALDLIEKMPLAESMTELSQLINDIADLMREGKVSEANYETAQTVFASRKAILSPKGKK